MRERKVNTRNSKFHFGFKAVLFKSTYHKCMLSFSLVLKGLTAATQYITHYIPLASLLLPSLRYQHWKGKHGLGFNHLNYISQ